MASLNPFDLLGEDEAEDPLVLLAAQEKAAALALAAAQEKSPGIALAAALSKKAPVSVQPGTKDTAKLQGKSARPAQPLRDSARNEAQRGRRGGARGRGGPGFNRDFVDRGSTFGSDGFVDSYKPSEDGEGGKGPSERQFNGGSRGGGGFRGGRRGGFSNGEAADGERPRRQFDRRSGTGRGSELKRGGSGRANWGAPVDETVQETEEPVAEEVKNVEPEKQEGEDSVADANKDSSPNEEEVKEPEEKEMTLEEYERLLEEKRKALLPLKTEERKVEVDKELKSMQLLSNKKNDGDIFIKLGSDKDKRKEAADKAKKSLSINEFLKPADGEKYQSFGGRGRGRGRGRGGYHGNSINMPAPAIEDALQFPALLAK